MYISNIECMHNTKNTELNIYQVHQLKLIKKVSIDSTIVMILQLSIFNLHTTVRCFTELISLSIKTNISDPLRAKKTFIKKKLGHTAVSAIKDSSVTLYIWQKKPEENTVYLKILT